MGMRRKGAAGRRAAGAGSEERSLRRFLLLSGGLHVVCFALAGVLPSISREPRVQQAPLMVSLVPLANIESRASGGPVVLPPRGMLEGAEKPAAKPAQAEPKVKSEAKSKPKTKSETKPETKPKDVQPGRGGRQPAPGEQTAGSGAGGRESSGASGRRGSPFGTDDSLRAMPSASSNLGMAARVDDSGFTYDYYLPQIVSRISAAWEQPAGISGEDNGPVATIRFRIERNGMVSELVVEQPSRVPLFDQSALLAVASVQPLPPLPPAYGCEWLTVHLRFVYTSGEARPAGLRRR